MWASVLQLQVVLVDEEFSLTSLLLPRSLRSVALGIPFHCLLELVVFKVINFNVLILDIIEQMLTLLPLPI